MGPDQLKGLLEQVAAGQLTADQAWQRCDPAAIRALPGATLDLGRPVRCGFGEVVYGEGKSAELIGTIAEALLAAQQREVLVTRCDRAIAETLQGRFAHQRYQPTARTLRLAARPILAPQPIPPTGSPNTAPPDTASPDTASQDNGSQDTASQDNASQDTATPAPPLAGPVAVVTAGSTDAAVAEEASETLAWMGVAVEAFEDLGVAGPQRVLTAVERLRHCEAVIVVAGMEGALPSVVAGHVACPVFAVPTSVGYGAALGGLTPLLGMLSSCAAHVAVVNIDAGFKGGYLAGLIATRIAAAKNESAPRPTASPA